MGSSQTLIMTLVVKEREFLHILRVHNTNLNGNATVPFAFTSIKGIGRRYSILCTKKAGIDITSHIISNEIGARLRQDLERLKKIRHHRGLRHYWGIRVRGQHTCSTGRRGRRVGQEIENLRYFWGKKK